MATTWSNWAGQQVCAPARIERPAGEEALAEVVTRAAREGRGVRAVGSGHSFTDTCLTDGVMVDLAGMQRVLDVDRTTGMVRVQAGITLHRLAQELATHGLALENQGDIDAQTLGGALATATHGTGARFRNLSSQVVACRLVTAAGDVLELDESTDADAWRAARVSVGALGVVSELTLQCVPAFRIHRRDETRAIPDVLAELDDLVARHDHFEMLALPHTGATLTMASRRTDEPASPPGRLSAWVNDDLVPNVGLGALTHLGRRFPGQTRRLAAVMARLAGSHEQLDESWKVFAHDRRVRFTEMEYAVPREHVVEVFQAVRRLIVARDLPVLFPIEVRFTAPDDALLSTAHGRDTAYVAVHQVVGAEYETYFRAVEEVVDGVEGRPHWGKRHYQRAETLAPRYPEWDRFQAVRARLDPEGLFTNDYVRRVLGPVHPA